MTSLSIELQRLNSEMILQRLPTDEALEVRDYARLTSAKWSAITDTEKKLNARKMEMGEHPKSESWNPPLIYQPVTPVQLPTTSPLSTLNVINPQIENIQGSNIGYPSNSKNQCWIDASDEDSELQELPPLSPTTKNNFKLKR